MAHLPLTGVNVTVLTFVAIDQALRLAAETMRTSDKDEYTNMGTGEFYMGQAAGTAWTYAMLLAVAGAIALVMTWIARRHGVTAPLRAGLVVFAIPFLFLLLVVTLGMPFWLSGANGEPVPKVLGDGPPWYLTAITTQTSLAAVAYIAGAVLMLRGGGVRRPGHQAAGPARR
ncbi:hypothetical protein DKM19_41520 [Streptosporangium sp. 'caverna']|nr:hypothetical protein DKM19_41520 [Streptosporangium sp. 'caverna']